MNYLMFSYPKYQSKFYIYHDGMGDAVSVEDDNVHTLIAVAEQLKESNIIGNYLIVKEINHDR